MFPGQSSSLCEHGGVPMHTPLYITTVSQISYQNYFFLLFLTQQKTNVFQFLAMKRFQRYGVCLDPTKKYTVLDSTGNHFLDHAIELTKKGKKFTIVLDNIDWEIRAHDMREEHQNVSEHAVASSLVFDQVPSDHLPDNGRQKDIKTTDLEFFLLSDDELSQIADRYHIYAGRIISKAFLKLSFLAALIPKHIPHQYSEEMNGKSEVITLPVLMKDEKKYADCVDVMDMFEDWAHEIHTKASGAVGINAPLLPPGRPAIHAPSQPDQPASHSPPCHILQNHSVELKSHVSVTS